MARQRPARRQLEVLRAYMEAGDVSGANLLARMERPHLIEPNRRRVHQYQ
jgi:hypothetical protein